MKKRTLVSVRLSDPPTKLVWRNLRRKLVSATAHELHAADTTCKHRTHQEDGARNGVSPISHEGMSQDPKRLKGTNHPPSYWRVNGEREYRKPTLDEQTANLGESTQAAKTSWRFQICGSR